jgi:hypothetical protein
MIGVVGTVVAIFVIWLQRPAKKSASRRMAPRAVVTPSSTGEYVRRSVARLDAAQSEPWSAPTVPPKNRDWVFDVFTPPEIRYDAATRHFIAKAPTLTIAMPSVPRATDPLLSEVEVVEIKRRPFRLQLVGFAETPKETLGLFEIVATSETVLAGTGRQIPELDLTVETLDVRVVESESDLHGTNRQRIAVAGVRHGKTGELTLLTTAERHMERSNRAVLRWGKASRVTKEVGIGDRVEVNGQLCEVVEVLAEPAAVTLAGPSDTSTGQKIIASSPTAKEERAPST